MKAEDAKKWKPIIDALAEGKKVELWEDGAWIEVERIDLRINIEEYRVKKDDEYTHFDSDEECIAAVGEVIYIPQDSTYTIILSFDVEERKFRMRNGVEYSPKILFDSGVTFRAGAPFGKIKSS